MRSDDKCWCGRLRREHINGQMCGRWLPVPEGHRTANAPLRTSREAPASSASASEQGPESRRV